MYKNYDQDLLSKSKFNFSGDSSEPTDFLTNQSTASKGVDFSKDTLAEQMPQANSDLAALGTSGTDVGAAGGGLTMAKANPYIAAAGLALNTIDKAYQVKNANAMARYQAKLADFNNRQKALERLSKPMAV